MITLDEITEGFKRREFFLEYQPIVRLATEVCVGAEALIRWARPSGLVSPMEFIPLVENTPSAGMFTYWVMEEAARELGDWLKDHDDVYLALNVPPELFGRGGLAYAATKSGLLPLANKLVLEITERGVPDKLGIDALNVATGDGFSVRIALDDLQLTGGNLVVLARLNIHIIKVEASALEYHPKRCEALLALMRLDAFNVVVECVETSEQARMFKNLGVPCGQGWYYSRSLRAQQFLEYYRWHS